LQGDVQWRADEADRQWIGSMERRYVSEARKLQAEATRVALVKVGRALFGSIGFHGAGIPELVAKAGVTRGALYHHFISKDGLFRAVFEEVAIDLKFQAQKLVADLKQDTWAQFIGGLSNYLHLLSTSDEAQQILMIDGPAVLGWDRWRTAQVNSIFGDTVRTLEMLVEQRVIDHPDPMALALLIHASLNEAALAIAHDDDHQGSSTRMTDALVVLLRGMRLQGEHINGGRSMIFHTDQTESRCRSVEKRRSRTVADMAKVAREHP
jgi:AcrR family transcriptional regulator